MLQINENWKCFHRINISFTGENKIMFESQISIILQ